MSKNISKECNKCGRLFMWRKVGDRWKPTNLNGTPHFLTCLTDPAYIKSQFNLIHEEGEDVNIESIQIGQNEYI